MDSSPSLSEEVSILCLLLPIFLFEDFSIFPDHISFSLRKHASPGFYQFLLNLLHLLTGQHFFFKFFPYSLQADLICLSKKGFFTALLPPDFVLDCDNT
ncbi:hypothetical protein [Candidatus Hodarchaeum mangrovi]